MRGHIRKHGKASWAVILDLGRDASGRRRQKWQSVQVSRLDAETESTRLLNQLRTGEYVEPSRIYVSDYLDRWLSDHARPRVSLKTFERYRQIVERELKSEFGQQMLAKLRPLHIQGFYAKALSNSRKTEKAASRLRRSYISTGCFMTHSIRRSNGRC